MFTTSFIEIKTLKGTKFLKQNNIFYSYILLKKSKRQNCCFFRRFLILFVLKRALFWPLHAPLWAVGVSVQKLRQNVLLRFVSWNVGSAKVCKKYLHEHFEIVLLGPTKVNVYIHLLDILEPFREKFNSQSNFLKFFFYLLLT